MATIPILANLNLNGNQILGLRIEVLAADPNGGELYEGRLWFNSTTDLLKYYNGTTVIELGAAAPSGVISLTVDNSTIQNTGTSTDPSIKVKDGGILNIHIGSGAAIELSKLETNPLARANHTGTQLAATISDLATVVQAYRLDQFAAPNTDISLASHKITNVTDPSSAQDAATKAYVDAVAAGLDWKSSVRAATTASITLSGTQTVDGVSLIVGDRVLVKSQSTGSENGIYDVISGAWTRSADANADAEVTAGLTVFVSEGTVNGNTSWTLTNDGAIVLGSTALVFTQVAGPGSYTAGTGLTLTGTQFTLTTPVTVVTGGTGATDAAGAKTNLGFLTRYAAAIGDGSTLTYTVTHNLGTRDVVVTVYDAASFAVVLADIVHATTNTVTVSFAVAPTTNAYRVVVIG